MIKILPYKMGSQSGRDLANALRCRRINPERETYGPRNRDFIVNWGNSSNFAERIFRQYPHRGFLNHPGRVEVASNKLSTFESLCGDGVRLPAGTRVPRFTTNRDEAIRWLLQDHKDIVCRAQLRANSGRGITLVTQDDNREDILPTVPLYVEYCKKRDEYRVHVVNGRVVDVQHKRNRRDDDGVNYQIRSYDNGWIFCREGVQTPEPVLDLAVFAVYSLRLDFGACDIGWNSRNGEAILFEINTAPGLEGQTLDTYVQSIREVVR